MLVSCFTFSAVPQLQGTRLASERDLLLLVYHPPVAHLPQVSRSTSRTPPQEKPSFSIQQDFVYESQKTYIYIYISLAVVIATAIVATIANATAAFTAAIVTAIAVEVIVSIAIIVAIALTVT